MVNGWFKGSAGVTNGSAGPGSTGCGTVTGGGTTRPGALARGPSTTCTNWTGNPSEPYFTPDPFNRHTPRTSYGITVPPDSAAISFSVNMRPSSLIQSRPLSLMIPP